jgi:hypothetical protein
MLVGLESADRGEFTIDADKVLLINYRDAMGPVTSYDHWLIVNCWEDNAELVINPISKEDAKRLIDRHVLAIEFYPHHAQRHMHHRHNGETETTPAAFAALFEGAPSFDYESAAVIAELDQMSEKLGHRIRMLFSSRERKRHVERISFDEIVAQFDGDELFTNRPVDIRREECDIAEVFLRTSLASLPPSPTSVIERHRGLSRILHLR